jgi:hypothetical protein
MMEKALGDSREAACRPVSVEYRVTLGTLLHPFKTQLVFHL